MPSVDGNMGINVEQIQCEPGFNLLEFSTLRASLEVKLNGVHVIMGVCRIPKSEQVVVTLAVCGIINLIEAKKASR